MAITYVNDLRLSEMDTGDNSGTWGTVTNTNLELIGEALGYGTEAITTNADTHASVIADGATDPVRAFYVEYTGTLDSACTITISPNTVNKVCFIENGTAGSQNIIISQGSGANVTIPPGDTKAVYLNGAGSGAAVTDAFASLNVSLLYFLALNFSASSSCIERICFTDTSPSSFSKDSTFNSLPSNLTNISNICCRVITKCFPTQVVLILLVSFSIFKALAFLLTRSNPTL